ncbi:MAG: chromosomal replication initiator protein DnaA [Pseudomonadota bacterium]|jgi:chromosomal replication initiator protein
MSENLEPGTLGLAAEGTTEPAAESLGAATPTKAPPSDENQETTIDQSWALAIADVCKNTNQHIVAAYIEPLELDLSASTNGHVVVRGPSRLICNYVNSRYAEQLKERLAFYAQTANLALSIIPYEKGSIAPQNQGLKDVADQAGDSELGEQRPAQYTPFVVKRVRKPEQQTTPNPDESQLTRPQGASSDSKTEPLESEVYNNINPRYTFADFVVGNSNQFCHAAAMRVAEKPGQSYNPLFIYGGVGLGKTHLLHAIGNAVLERSPSSRVLYMSSETFTNELILALRHAKMDEFKRKLRAIEVLLIDDIQFISGKERTQEEFFHTFNALYSAKRQIVITSDKIPTDIPGIEERLQTRFSWGLTADLQAPDFETRVAILKQKALLEQFQLPHEVSHLIAERISSNVRELEGALTRLHAMSSIQSVPISLEMAKSALKPLLQPKVVNVTVDDIKKAVANHFNLKVTEIVSKRRTKNLSFPRHIAMYLCRKHTTASYPEIGEHFGGRDHSSVIHAASVVSSKLSTDRAVKEAIENIEKSIFG